MIIVAGHVTVAPQQRQTYLASCVKVVEQARRSAGCLDFVITSDLVDAGRINIFERWESQAAVDAFRSGGPSDDQSTAMHSASVAEYDISDARSLIESGTARGEQTCARFSQIEAPQQGRGNKYEADHHDIRLRRPGACDIGLGESTVQLLRVQNFTVSRDGFGAGENQSFERPFGHADPGAMFAWAGATASWPNRTDPGGSRGLDDYLTRDFSHNIGAEIMGRNKFSPHRGPWRDHDWKGWWGDEPPFHTPVFVMTHHDRPSFTLSDTTFHFVNDEPGAVLERAREAAQGKDVRLGGGATIVREFLDADLVDTLHVAVSEVELGSGVRLWESPDELNGRFHHDVVPSRSGVTHHLFWRR